MSYRAYQVDTAYQVSIERSLSSITVMISRKQYFTAMISLGWHLPSQCQITKLFLRITVIMSFLWRSSPWVSQWYRQWREKLQAWHVKVFWCISLWSGVGWKGQVGIFGNWSWLLVWHFITTYVLYRYHSRNVNRMITVWVKRIVTI